jgi:uncharacterized coiled-coil protein SlyX
MSNYEKKEFKIAQQIADTLEKLDKTLEKLEDTDSKVKSYFEQEKAIHEIKKALKDAKKLDKLETKDVTGVIKETDKIENKDYENLSEITNTIDKLEISLNKLGDSESNKIKSFIEQEKAIHYIKTILKKFGYYNNI